MSVEQRNVSPRAFGPTSLMARLLTYFMLLSLLTVGLVGTIAFFQARAALRASIFERLAIAATLKEDDLQRWVADQRQQILFLAGSPTIQSHAPTLLTTAPSDPAHEQARAALTPYLARLLDYDSDFKEILFLSDVGGRVLLSTDPASEGSYRVTDRYFTQGQQGPYVQNVYPSPQSGRPAMTIAVPLYDERGQRVGVLAAHLNLERLDRVILERTGLGTSGESYLVDPLNLFVSEQRFGRDTFPRGIHSWGIDTAIQGEDGQALYLNYQGVPVLGAYRWIDGLELALLVEMEQEEAFAPARQLAWTIFFIGLGVTVVLSLIIYLVARQIARPILAITDAAAQVAAGDLGVRAPVITHDEIGLLARTFNQMTYELRSLYEALQRSEKHFRSLIENASDIITVLDEDGTIRYESPSIERLFGYAPERLVGSNALEWIHPEDRPQALDILQRAQDGGDPHRTEFRFRHQDGSWRIVEAISRNLLNDPAVGGVVINSRDVTQRRQRERELEAIATMSMALRAAPTRATMLPLVLDQLIELLEAAGAAISLHGPEQPQGQVALARGCWLELSGRVNPLWEEIGRRVSLTNHPYLRSLLPQGSQGPTDEIDTLACIPLIAREQTIGLLWIGRRLPFTPDELRIITAVADIAANAIYRASLHDQLEESYIETVLALARAMDARDDYTGDHSQRLARWVEATARAMALPEKEIEGARWGALLHDIGKIGVPDGILRKPGRLTPEEYALMKRHPVIGAEILAPVKRLATVAPIVRAHHERYDGHGYPDGLKGEAIPLPARILTVADAYSAMTDDRVYRRGLSHAEAADELRRQAGRQFDPRVVEHFLVVLESQFPEDL